MAARKSCCQVNYYIQRFRYAALGRWAVSIRTYLLIFPFGYLVTTERELIFNEVGLSRAALIALAGELSSFLYLFIAQALLLGNREYQLQPMWQCFFVWSSTGAVRGLAVAAYANWAFGYEWELIRRVPAAIGYTTVVMALAALYFGSIDRRRTEFRALQTLGQVLSQEEEVLLREDARIRARAQEVLEIELLPQVRTLQVGIESALQLSARDNSDVVLQKLYEQSLRIGTELEAQRSLLEQDFQEPSHKGEGNKAISYWAALLPQIMSVRVTVLFFSLGAISGQFSRNGIIGVAAGLLGLIPLLIVIVPISQLIKKRSDKKVQLFLIGFAGVYLASYFYNVIQPLLGFNLTYPYEPWYSAAKTVYGLYFASVIASLLVDSSEKREQASELGIATSQNVDQLVIRNYQIEKAAFATQYGTLQGKISGVTMALHLLSTQSMGAVSSVKKIELLKNANLLLGETLVDLEKLKVSTL